VLNLKGSAKVQGQQHYKKDVPGDSWDSRYQCGYQRGLAVISSLVLVSVDAPQVVVLRSQSSHHPSCLASHRKHSSDILGEKINGKVFGNHDVTMFEQKHILHMVWTVPSGRSLPRG